MSYYWFNRQELLQKTKEKYDNGSNEKATKYYRDNRKSWKEFGEPKDIDQKYYYSNYYDASINKYDVKCGTSLRFWENKGWIYLIDPYGWFQSYFSYCLDRRSVDDERQINR